MTNVISDWMNEWMNQCFCLCFIFIESLFLSTVCARVCVCIRVFILSLFMIVYLHSISVKHLHTHNKKREQSAFWCWFILKLQAFGVPRRRKLLEDDRIKLTNHWNIEVLFFTWHDKSTPWKVKRKHRVNLEWNKLKVLI